MPEMGSILLVDDDPNDVELVLRDFRTNNLLNEVVVVRDGSEAIDYLFFRGSFATREEKNPILILLDLHLPKLDGRAVLSRIRECESLKQIPVIILIPSDPPDFRTEEYPPFEATMVKPIKFKKMAESMRKLPLLWAVLSGPPSPS